MNIKAIVGLGAFALGLNATCFAGGYGMAGCGLGALAFRDQPGKIQIISATLNNIISPQTFAITSGTSNCDSKDDTDSAQHYIKENQVALKKDVARARGETLAGLLQMMGCQATSQALSQELQKNYAAIFAPGAGAAGIEKAISDAIRNNPDARAACI